MSAAAVIPVEDGPTQGKPSRSGCGSQEQPGEKREMIEEEPEFRLVSISALHLYLLRCP
jgi:hypothetical protein